MATNCWEHKRCGRQPNGLRSKELGVCPACVEQSADGRNAGFNGGRICWAITGTFCGGRVQGTFAQKLTNCMDCDFFRLVQLEQGTRFKARP